MSILQFEDRLQLHQDNIFNEEIDSTKILVIKLILQIKVRVHPSHPTNPKIKVQFCPYPTNLLLPSLSEIHIRFILPPNKANGGRWTEPR